MSVNVRITYEVALTDTDELLGLADSAFTYRAHKALMNYMIAMRLGGAGLAPMPDGYGKGVDAILSFPNETKIEVN
jgi:hypothetical protein